MIEAMDAISTMPSSQGATRGSVSSAASVTSCSTVTTLPEMRA